MLVLDGFSEGISLSKSVVSYLEAVRWSGIACCIQCIYRYRYPPPPCVAVASCGWWQLGIKQAEATRGFTAAVKKVQTWHEAHLGHFRQMQVLSQGNTTSKLGVMALHRSISQSLSNPHRLHLPRTERCSQRSLWEYHSAKVYPSQPPRSNVDHGPWRPHRLAWDTKHHQSPNFWFQALTNSQPVISSWGIWQWLVSTRQLQSTPFPLCLHHILHVQAHHVTECQVLGKSPCVATYVQSKFAEKPGGKKWGLLMGFKRVLFGFNVKLLGLGCVSIVLLCYEMCVYVYMYIKIGRWMDGWMDR